jgi:hypothetical protein
VVRKDTASVLKVNEAWALLQNVMTQTADTILDRTERVTHKDWLDAECEQARASKNCAYKKKQQKIIHENQLRNTELTKVRKKEYINKRRRYLLNVELRNWNVSEATMKTNLSKANNSKEGLLT